MTEYKDLVVRDHGLWKNIRKNYFLLIHKYLPNPADVKDWALTVASKEIPPLHASVLQSIKEKENIWKS